VTEPIKKITTKAGETRYRFVIDVGTKPNGKRDQRCYTFGNFKDARAARAKIIADRNRGVLVKPTKVTFDELCQRWLDSRHDVREVTALANGHALKRARAQLGKIQVQQIARADVEGVIRSIQESGLRHRSMEVTRNAIKQVLAYAITEGLISINVAAYVKLPRKPHSDAKPITVWEPSELLAFREVADRDEWAAGWRLTLCGLRRSEVLGLKWSAVDLDRGEIRVEASRVLLDGGTRTVTDDPKSKASRRTVPVEAIQPGTVAILRSLRARQAADKLALGEAYEETGLVLVDALGRPLRPEAYSDRFPLLSRQAGVPVVILHAVRHTLALMMHRAGIAPADAAALLGHTLAVHLARYVPLTERGARSAASGLGEALVKFS
jgi:integrase